MTIHEIEATLDDLIARHSDLDEAMLTTLLSASGWDEKTTGEAKILLKGRLRGRPTSVATMQSINNEAPTQVTQPVSTPELLSLPVNEIIQPVKIGNEISVPIPEQPAVVVPVVAQEQVVPVPEPQSLITPIVPPVTISNPNNNQELPHDLPLKPFESAPQVWPFSKYKDVFYGEVMPKLSDEEKKLAEKQRVEQLHIEATPLTGKDESLIFMACVALVAILLLLGYMYSNGRL